MTSFLVAQLGPRSEVADVVKHSSVPGINTLSADFHPLQTIAGSLTFYEDFHCSISHSLIPSLAPSLGLEDLKIAWVGDSNNVLFDIAMGAIKMGCISLSHHRKATPSLPLFEANILEEAIKDADPIVTDTWTSIGQEAESAKRLKAIVGHERAG